MRYVLFSSAHAELRYTAQPDFYYWEIIVMIRKILMVCVAVWLSYDIQIQALCATLLVVIALCVHALACPYVTDAMDGLELLSLFGSFCSTSLFHALNL